ncbi:MAG TPA: type 1 glutamine amidotransferase [Acidimicrobiales bacterium]|nr:type 1 glutamine amidotransferase [Acidimicrobiales bacterium]
MSSAGTDAAGRRPGGADGPRLWFVLQHVDHEGPGLIADALTAAGWGVQVVRPDHGQPLPDAGSLAGLVVLGGPMGVHDTATHPWLEDERVLIGEAARTGRPVLGVCLGAQQLAASLGAAVTTGAAPEIGLGHVELTPAGRTDRVLGPEYGGLADPRVPCLHWHQDTFALPDGAAHLAATARYPHQAFRWGSRAYGLQFHIEVDPALAAAWLPKLPDGVGLEGAGLAAVESAGRRVLRRFVAASGADEPADSMARTGSAR